VARRRHSCAEAFSDVAARPELYYLPRFAHQNRPRPRAMIKAASVKAIMAATAYRNFIVCPLVPGTTQPACARVELV
jgi:hypothetical protein